MAYEKETLTKILYYGEISPNSKQFIQDLVDKKDKEIERLNNIIDELEKAILNTYPCMNMYEQDFKSELLNILKELKGEN